MLVLQSMDALAPSESTATGLLPGAAADLKPFRIKHGVQRDGACAA